MKVDIKMQIRNVAKGFQVTIYEQEDGLYYVIRVKTDEYPSTPGVLQIYQSLTASELQGLMEEWLELKNAATTGS